jgi:hypothetical protein
MGVGEIKGGWAREDGRQITEGRGRREYRIPNKEFRMSKAGDFMLNQDRQSLKWLGGKRTLLKGYEDARKMYHMQVLAIIGW